MLWCSTEEQLHQFSEEGKRDPRYKPEDWVRLLKKIEDGLEELGAGIPKVLVKQKT